MLKRFSTTGYRSFCNKITLDFGNPHDYNWHNGPSADDNYIRNGIISNALVVGENATGKTNLGHALMDITKNFIRRSPSFYERTGEEDSTYLNGDNSCGFAEFEYVFLLDETKVEYIYHKNGFQNMLYEKLMIDDKLVFEYDFETHTLNGSGLALVCANGLNWDFADDEMSVLGYLSNSLPRNESPAIYTLRKFIDGMGMINVPTRATRYFLINGALGTIIRSEKLVDEFEQFLRSYGVYEKLQVVDGPDGKPTLYFKHNRLIPFAQACSSGTLTLLLLFSRFVMHVEDRQRAVPSSFLYIDEFDAYLHYDVAQKLVSYFGSIDTCQTICSTHNTSLVKNSIMRPDCVFKISKDTSLESNINYAKLRIDSLADSTRREIRRINNVENLLRNGEFG